MIREDGKVENSAQRPTYTPPKITAKGRKTQTVQPTRFNPKGVPQQYTPPVWWNELSDSVSNWIDKNVSGSQYIPAGLSQPQRPTTAAQFKPPLWGGNSTRVSEPSDPSLPTGTFFSGGSIADGTREVRTGQNTSVLLGGGGIRNQGTVRIAKGIPMIGEPSYTAPANGGGFGTTYKNYRGGGRGGGRGSAYSSDKVPSWLMNLYNWNFKG